MKLRDQWEHRRRQWAEFNRWEAEQPPVDRAAGDIIADLGFIWTWLPAEVSVPRQPLLLAVLELATAKLW
jgi:hypothetical protein